MNQASMQKHKSTKNLYFNQVSVSDFFSFIFYIRKQKLLDNRIRFIGSEGRLLHKISFSHILFHIVYRKNTIRIYFYEVFAFDFIVICSDYNEMHLSDFIPSPTRKLAIKISPSIILWTKHSHLDTYNYVSATRKAFPSP